jgi:hypothetical protein
MLSSLTMVKLCIWNQWLNNFSASDIKKKKRLRLHTCCSLCPGSSASTLSLTNSFSASSHEWILLLQKSIPWSFSLNYILLFHPQVCGPNLSFEFQTLISSCVLDFSIRCPIFILKLIGTSITPYVFLLQTCLFPVVLYLSKSHCYYLATQTKDHRGISLSLGFLETGFETYIPRQVMSYERALRKNPWGYREVGQCKRRT